MLGAGPMTDAEQKPQVDPDHYRAAYENRRRFISYWNQIDQADR